MTRWDWCYWGGNKGRVAQRTKWDIPGWGYLFLNPLEKWVVTAAPGLQCFPAGTVGAPSTVLLCWWQQHRALQPCQAVGTTRHLLAQLEWHCHPGLLPALLPELVLLLCSVTIWRHASGEECLLVISVSQLFSLLACVSRILSRTWFFLLLWGTKATILWNSKYIATVKL